MKARFARYIASKSLKPQKAQILYLIHKVQNKGQAIIYYRTEIALLLLLLCFTETTTATKIFRLGGGLPESPRSVANGNKSGQTSNGLLLKSKIEEIRQKGLRKSSATTETKDTEDDDDQNEESEDLKPFTVVRVSSSVSQVILQSIDG